MKGSVRDGCAQQGAPEDKWHAGTAREEASQPN